MFVIGCASEMTAMSLFPIFAGSTKPGCRTKLVLLVPGPAICENDIVEDGVAGSKTPEVMSKAQCAAVRIVRELISEPLQNEPGCETPGTPGLNRLTTLANLLPES